MLLVTSSLMAQTTVTQDGVTYTLYSPEGAERYAVVTSSQFTEETNLILPSSVEYEGAAYSVTQIARQGFAYKSLLTSIIVPNSVTFIDEAAFWQSGIISIELPNSITTIEESTFGYCKFLTSIKIPDSVTRINDTAFQFCEALTSVILPNSLKEIGEGVFKFSGVKSIDLPNSLSHLGKQAFYYCRELESITFSENLTEISDETFYACSIPNVDLPNDLTSIGKGAFLNCPLTSLTIPPSVTYIGELAFQGAKITSLTIPPSITKIEDRAFLSCQSLASLEVPNTVTSIGVSAFAGTALTTLTLPNSVTYISENAFATCLVLTSVYLPDALSGIGKNAFEGSYNIEEIYYPTLNPISTSDKAFDYRTYNKATLHIHKGILDKIANCTPWNQFKNIKDELDATPSLPIEITQDNIKYSLCTSEEGKPYAIVKGHTFDWESERLDVIIPDFLKYEDVDYPVTIIGEYSLYKLQNLYSVLIPNTVTTIEEGAFYYSPNLTSVSLPNSIREIGKVAFFESGLSSLILPNSLSILGDRAFYYCKSLASVEIPESVTQIGSEAFKTCPELTEILYTTTNLIEANDNIFDSETYEKATLTVAEGGLNKAKETTPWNLFINIKEENNKIPVEPIEITQDRVKYTLYITEEGTHYAKITGNDLANLNEEVKLSLPSSIKHEEIEYPIIEIGQYSLYKLPNLLSVSVPNSVTTIGNGAFYGNYNMISVEIPNSVTEIGNEAFAGCAKLTSLSLPESIIKIGKTAFAECQSLTSIILPSSVKEIGNGCFIACANLASVTLPANIEVIGNNAFMECKQLVEVTYLTANPIETSEQLFSEETYDNATLTVAEGGLQNVKTTTPWNLFKNVKENITVPTEPVQVTLNYLTYAIYFDVEEPYARVIFNSLYTSEEPVDLDIPSSISYNDHEYPVRVIGAWLFEGCENLISVVIPNSVTTIENNAFHNCHNLTSVTIPNSVTKIGTYAFFDCNSLESIILPESLTLLDAETFLYCKGLKSIVLPNSLTLIGEKAFVECTALTEIFYDTTEPITADSNIFDEPTYRNAILTVADGGLENAKETTPWNLFKNIKEVSGDLPSEPVTVTQNYITYTLHDSELGTPYAVVTGNTIEEGEETHKLNILIPSSITYNEIEYSVTEIAEKAFFSCYRLDSITIPETVTLLGNSAFEDCMELTSVKLPESIRVIPKMAFEECVSLKEIMLPLSVREIHRSAFAATGLTSIVLPDSITSIEASAFTYCPYLSEVVYKAAEPITAESDIFDETTYNKATLIVADGTLEKIKETTPWNLFANIKEENAGEATEPIEMTQGQIKYTLYDLGNNIRYAVVSGNEIVEETNLILPPAVEYDNVPYPVTIIGHDAFNECSVLTSIIIPATVSDIEQWAFANCSNLAFVEIPATVVTIGEEAFFNCPTLAEVYYTTNEPIETESNIFSEETYENAQLYVALGGLEKAKETMPWKLFDSIIEKDFTIGIITKEDGLIYSLYPEEDGNHHATVISNDIDQLIDLGIPPTITHDGIEYTVTTIGRGAFKSCNFLVYVTVPNSITEIESFAFADCKALGGISLPESMTSIGMGIFANCNSLSQINIPTTITSIGTGAFAACVSLPKLNIPNSVKTIGKGAFAGCIALTTLNIPESVETIGGAAFGACTSLVTLNLPKTLQGIGKGAFFGCTGLKEIYYLSTDPISAANETFSPETYIGATLYVEVGGLEKARTVAPWNLFMTIQEDSQSGIENVLSELDVTLPIEIYDFNGVKVASELKYLSKGSYIIRQGDKVMKIVVR